MRTGTYVSAQTTNFNNVTRKNVCSLPSFNDMLGWWQIEVDEQDREADFVTLNGLYEFQVMPFEL